jgi:hypothetical protein
MARAISNGVRPLKSSIIGISKAKTGFDSP